ncbi:odorant receptor Or2-like [Aricia agestis]|uniref:odorant receptor Or2-like n=1 Tax=Aricia agestis TaxID=91739 RepID=UPI001C20A5C7|nr:odorant receptor Or2-like [Aricia agestis]
MSSLLNRFEDPENPLLGPTLWGLQTWGMWQPKPGLAKNLYNLLHFLIIFFIISQYVELWIIRENLEMALRNLSITMLSSVCVIKAGTFVFWQKNWRDIVDFVRHFESYQRRKKDDITQNFLDDYKRYSRKVTVCYWSLVAATVFTVVLTPLASFMSSAEYRMQIRNGTKPYPEILSSWTPFDRTRGIGYILSLVMHALICVYGGGIVANYDTNVVVLMSFFTGQLGLLRAKCERLFENINSYSDAVKNVRECHKHHDLLVRYAKILDSVLSPVLFVYVIICSLMICASATQLTSEGTTAMQQVWIAEYLAALIAQLFLYCWHSNQVYYMSLVVDTGVYQSGWWSQEVRMRRCVLLLAGQLNRNIIFSAGPFTKLSVPTFVTILKGSYSYYTILSKK